jgi:hypothetical protein
VIPVQSIPALSIVIAVVSGKDALRKCIDSLYGQARSIDAEVIVPYDQWTLDVLELRADFPDLHFVDADSQDSLKSFNHSHYDRRRAVGIANARGHVIALTEDHAVPSSDWCERILRAHSESETAGVIGGAIENEVDSALNWAWYYCDFGRYGRPLPSEHADYVSDVNVSYKRAALMSVREVWQSAYRETSVHWALSRNGQALRLDPAIVVYQHRPQMSLRAAVRERIEWGRAFAETRSREIGSSRRTLFAIGALLLPLVLFVRALKLMIRQSRSLSQIAKSSPLIMLLVMFWSIGEAIGYVSPRRDMRSGSLVAAESTISITP